MKKLFAVFFIICNIPVQAQSVLSNGDWFKMEVSENGIYKLDYNYLRNAGLDVRNLDPRNLRIYSYPSGILPQRNADLISYDPVELAIQVIGEEDGRFDQGDFLLFYGQNGHKHRYIDDSLVYEHNIYSNENYYFLTVSSESGKRLTQINSLGTGFDEIRQYNAFQYFKQENYNLLTSGRSWYTERFNQTINQEYNLNLGELVAQSKVKLTINVMAQAFNESTFTIRANDQQIGDIAVRNIPDFTKRQFRYAIKGYESLRSFNIDAVNNGNYRIGIQYNKNPDHSIGFFDFILLEGIKPLKLTGDQTTFRSTASVKNSTSEYIIAEAGDATTVWNITDPFDAAIQQSNSSNSTTRFSASSDILHEYVIFSNSLNNTPNSIERIGNQNLKRATNAELLIITPTQFRSEAQRLANFRESNDNLNTEVVEVAKIFNEFSGGRQDVSAIRNLVKYLYDNGSLKYVLLFGRGSYDYKNRIPNNTNLVPIYESRISLDPLDTYASDDYYAFLEDDEGEWNEFRGGNHTMDIGVGRLPVTTSQEARGVVDKLIHYATSEKTFGMWRNDVVFVADDGDFNLHQRQADELTVFVDTTFSAFQPDKFFLDNFQQISRPSGEVAPDANEKLDETVENGALILNFTGHGNENVWMDEQILNLVQIDSWSNLDRLPLFVTATCEFGRHDDPRRISGGEKVVTNPKGGGIAIVSTCRPVSSSSNFALNKAFYESVYEKEDGEYLRLGDVFKLTKNKSVDLATDQNRVGNRNFALLGDPSMRLAYPKQNLVLTSIYNTSDQTSQLSALGEVTLTGAVLTNDSTIDRQFNGEVEFVIHDKEVTRTTLGNENTPFTYLSKDNVIFKGSSRVSNGEFEINFIVPKNINYELGKGKINLYALSDTGIDANGSDINLTIGGSSGNTKQDDVGPTVELYLGDTLNTNLSNVSHNTELVVILEDESGINLSSFGVDNNITATLDDEFTFVLNDYYKAFTDTYQRGMVRFPLNDLEKGKHKIVVRAWDTFNNSTETEIEFSVADPNEVVIYKVANYPNPATSFTNFKFTHNRSGEDLQVILEIISPSAGRVLQKEFRVDDSSSEVELYNWDTRGINGDNLNPGLYVYRIVVRSIRDGAKNQAHQKLILIN